VGERNQTEDGLLAVRKPKRLTTDLMSQFSGHLTLLLCGNRCPFAAFSHLAEFVEDNEVHAGQMIGETAFLPVKGLGRLLEE
jgi:hypothetical protein